MGTAEAAIAPAPRTTPAIRWLLSAIAAALALALVLGGAYTLLDLAARHTFETRSSYSGVRSLIVDASAGDVVITGAPNASAVQVVEHVSEGLSTPSRQAVREPGGELRLHETCPGLFGTSCDVSYTIAVPNGVEVIASSGAGDVTARDLRTRSIVRLSSGAGDVTAASISAPDVRLSSGAGDIHARLSSPLTRLVASSGAGDVDLTVPNAVYSVAATSGAGTVSDGSVRTDPAAARSIHATSGAGDVTIRVSR